MKWVLGVGLHPNCEGTLAWLQWCREQQGMEVEATAVHVLEWVTQSVYPPPKLSVVDEHMRRFLSDRGHDLDIRIIEGRAPADALIHAMSLHAADMLVIGRQASRDGDQLVRLGRVARRVLRRLPGPLTVCPSDLRVEDIPEGPVMIAVQPGPGCEHAVRFGRQMAERLGRAVAVATAIAPAFSPGITYAPAPRYDGERRQRALDHLMAWLAERGLTEVTPLMAEGSTIPVLLEAAEELAACMIVTGSRLLTTSERLTRSSVGTTLASVARVPVCVVPPW